jgi:ATP-dependent DNA helicase MPH1
MCFRSLTEEAEGDSSEKRSGLNKDPAFQALMDELRLQKSRGFAIHPKLEKLKTLVVQHFGQRLRDDGSSNADDRSDDTRAIVFVTFREAVDEIVSFLNQESPLLRATKFIGQGIDRKGIKGLAQREQLDVSSYSWSSYCVLCPPLTFSESSLCRSSTNSKVVSLMFWWRHQSGKRA